MARGVVFDLDDTLIDRRASITTYARRLYRDFESAIGTPIDEFVCRFLELDGNGYVDRKSFCRGLAAFVASREMSPDAIADHFASLAWSRPILMPGAQDACRRLRAAGIPLGIVTNGSSYSQRSKIVNSGLHELVDHIVISEEVGAKKPDPAIFAYLCEHLGIVPQVSWLVGDHPLLDVVGASRAGFQTIWLQRSIAWPAEHPRCYTCEVEDLQHALDEILGNP